MPIFPLGGFVELLEDEELAERMAGQLSVSSQPGQTVFTLELPDD